MWIEKASGRSSPFGMMPSLSMRAWLTSATGRTERRPTLTTREGPSGRVEIPHRRMRIQG
jgi:hypothetical protein